MVHLEFSLPVLMIHRYEVNAKFSWCQMGTIIEAITRRWRPTYLMHQLQVASSLSAVMMMSMKMSWSTDTEMLTNVVTTWSALLLISTNICSRHTLQISDNRENSKYALHCIKLLRSSKLQMISCSMS